MSKLIIPIIVIIAGLVVLPGLNTTACPFAHFLAMERANPYAYPFLHIQTHRKLVSAMCCLSTPSPKVLSLGAHFFICEKNVPSQQYMFNLT